MPNPIRGAPPRFPLPPQPESGQPVHLCASGRLMRWIIQVPAATGDSLGHTVPAGALRPTAGMRPVDANRATLRNAIEGHLPSLLQKQLGEGREVSGCLRAAINLSCDHVDGWMRRTLEHAWLDRALTSSEVQEGLRKAEEFAEKLLNEADDGRLRTLIFEESDRAPHEDLARTLG